MYLGLKHMAVVLACMGGLVAATGIAVADDASGPVTFTKDVLPILQQNCQECHRPSGPNHSGMVAPMSFM